MEEKIRRGEESVEERQLAVVVEKQRHCHSDSHGE